MQINYLLIYDILFYSIHQQVTNLYLNILFITVYIFIKLFIFGHWKQLILIWGFNRVLIQGLIVKRKNVIVANLFLLQASRNCHNIRLLPLTDELNQMSASTTERDFDYVRLNVIKLKWIWPLTTLAKCQPVRLNATFHYTADPNPHSLYSPTFAKQRTTKKKKEGKSIIRITEMVCGRSYWDEDDDHICLWINRISSCYIYHTIKNYSCFLRT